jgi:hypothetical protein
MKRVGGRVFGAGLLGAAIALTGCGSGGGSGLMGTSPARATKLVGRIAAPPGVSLQGTQVVAELLVGGRTATMRAITGASDGARRDALLDAARTGRVSPIPGLYTTTAMADGSFAFRGLPAGEYTLMARQGGMIALLPDMQVGGAETKAARVMRLAAVGVINGKIRYAHPNEQTPDNSGILAFVKGTSLVGYTQGASGDYSIPNVPNQVPEADFYTVVAIAGGFADDEIIMRERLTGQTATAPLIFMRPGGNIAGRITDPTITNIERQGLSGVSVVSLFGQSAVTNTDGYFILRGMQAGANHLTITRQPYKTIRTSIEVEAGSTRFLAYEMVR